ncbi:MAG: polysaccharide biosynthesis/export family protein [Dysgonamonadaceae bacterium]|jgi:polysaccharide export outer membrane protein|nr:polysaccharide biosynthesis/export family protein [Dysgonamonadaceae bacterium]
MRNKSIFFTIVCFFILSSCGSRKDIVYFQDIDQLKTLTENSFQIVKIMPYDNLFISVSTINPQASEVFNIVKSSISTSALEWQGYLVDEKGEINFPMIGKIHLAGLTKTEATELIQAKVAEYVQEPIVNIRFLNYRVHVLGEVNRPGTYVINSEKITIPEALALANDMTLYGDRHNVLICRTEDGNKKFYRVDMTSSSIFNSEVYYLRQNDMIYVEPNSARARNSTNYTTNVSVFVSITSILLTAATFFLVTLKK